MLVLLHFQMMYVHTNISKSEIFGKYFNTRFFMYYESKNIVFFFNKFIYVESKVTANLLFQNEPCTGN